MTKKVVIVTTQVIDGARRQLGWFKRSRTDLYFDVVGLFPGSHTSYHKDGKIFTTSPLTDNRPMLDMNHLPLDRFQGWHQFGIAMIRRARIPCQPPLKPSDATGITHLVEIDLDRYPSETLNFVIELIHPDSLGELDVETLRPPPDADVTIVRFFDPFLVLTTLGHDHNLLIRPAHKGVMLEHFNSRYTASRKDQRYRIEAYKDE